MASGIVYQIAQAEAQAVKLPDYLQIATRATLPYPIN
jgi:hypothetical protein